jgi:hypothetical protein
MPSAAWHCAVEGGAASGAPGSVIASGETVTCGADAVRTGEAPSAALSAAENVEEAAAATAVSEVRQAAIVIQALFMRAQ